MDFALPADHKIKLKENEKKDKYLNLARELEKLWNMKVTIITIVIGTFGERPLFKPHHKMGAVTFVCFYIFVTGV